MKLCVSTKGWHTVHWADFLRVSSELGYAGIEIHNIDSPMLDEPRAPGDLASAFDVRHDVFTHQLEISCINSLSFLNRDDSEHIRQELRHILTYAVALKIPFVRIRAFEHIATLTDDEEDRLVAEEIRRLLPDAEQNDITLLIETSGIYSDTARLRRLLNGFASDHLAVLWELCRPFRDHQESAQDTISNLGAYVRHVHIRDFNETGYCLIGEGKLPIDTMVNALESINYSGGISLEWDPAWLPEVNDITAILAHFSGVMKPFGKKQETQELYYNKIHTGLRVWPKETLIPHTFSQVLDVMVERFPDQYCFKYTTLDYTRTYAQFRDDVDTFARALLAMGVRPGMKVAIWATNIPAWYITFWATVKIGAVLVTVNTAYKIHEVEYLLRQSDTHTLVMIENCLDSDYAGIMRQLCPELQGKEPSAPLHNTRLPFLRHIVTAGFRMEGCMTFEEATALSAKVSPETVRYYAEKVDRLDVCNIQYTSGTTGFPKGVMLTHYGIVNNGKCIGDRMDFSTADRLMIQVPMFHCFGMVLAMTAAMTHGATISPLPYFSAQNALTCINQEKITAFHGVPTMFIAMFNHPDYAKTDFSHMRTGIMAGAGCPPELMRRAAQPSPVGMNMRGIVSVYGQTESSPGCTMSELDDPLDERCETVGYAFPHVECRIIDPETGNELPDGENGEFVARGYNIMKGYYKMPEATAAAIDTDGWLHSGDIACRLPGGTFKITGRIKDMIIRGGENIYPKEVEEFIYTNPKVKDVQVIGVPDTRYGEEICACIILKPGETCTEEEMKAFVLASMAKHKVPRYVDFMEAFPMNAAGKILKYQMRKEAAERHPAE